MNDNNPEDWIDANGEFMADFPEGFLSRLDGETADKLLDLIAGIAERSYRRGFQQGAFIQENGGEYHSPLGDWRYGVCYSRALSPEADRFETTSRERLGLECAGWLDHVFGCGRWRLP